MKLAKDQNLNVQEKLGHIIKAPVVLCTTKCIQNELKLFGAQFDHLLQDTYNMKRLFCEHSMSLEPS